ncbi:MULTISPECIES: sensor histidine kinase [unclassified Kitasatospora]|uniref:sensor histidine kinase n=1 Tax=unclassified Kitasatospora TaxID=2633591 RepID=UPI0024754C72|nr:histidine kinase [Kitasatospora sp. MAP12-44]
MELLEGRELRRQVRAVLWPERQAPKLPRWSLWADVVLAVLVTVVVLLSMRHGVIAWQGTAPVPPAPAVAPLPPGPAALPQMVVPVPPAAKDYVVASLAALMLAARRRLPLATFWVVLIAARADFFLPTFVTVLTCGIAIGAAAFHSRNPAPVMGSFALAAVLVTTTFQNAAPNQRELLVILLILGLLGSAGRFWQLRYTTARLRFTELQEEQEAAMRRAVEEERSRIASELHDVVTHNVSVMVIQAGAARTVLDSSPEMAKEAMLAVEAGGRAAMAELRHVMGLLAVPGTGAGGETADGRPSPDELEPQPGLGQLNALVQRVRATGLPVTVSMSLPPGPMLPGTDLTAYRVVQEALTNTIKHAVGAESTITIDHDDHWLTIEAVDTGGTPGVQSLSGNSRGLLGLRERLAVYGGALDAGRTIGGGYRLKARIPWSTP